MLEISPSTIPAITTPLSRALDRLGRQQVLNAIFALGFLLLGGAKGYELWRGPVAYFIPPGGPGMVRAGVIDDSLATSWSSQVLADRFTFVPATLAKKQQQFREALHPALLPAFERQAEEERRLVGQKVMSAQLTVLTSAVQKRHQGVVFVHLTAVRSVWVGSQRLPDEEVQASMAVMPWTDRGQAQGVALVQFIPTPPLGGS